MAGEYYYISDLHLSPQTTALNQLFSHFLDEYAHNAAALTINGDLFASYFGFKQLKNRFYRDICYRLSELVKSGTRVDFVAGNRDFLFWEDAFTYRMRGYRNEVYRTLPSEKVAAIHGDRFCLDDRSYQFFRKVIRALPLRKANYVTPAFVGSMIARTIRGFSKSSSKRNKKPQSYFDIKDQPVVNFIRQVGCDTLVCGHIHKPQERIYRLRGRGARMLVLGDWSDRGAVIARGTNESPLELCWYDGAGIEPWEHEVQQYEIQRTADSMRE